MDNIIALIPPILACAAFFGVWKLMVNADRIERRAEAQFEADAATADASHES